jgi:hypothetical protein
MSFDCSAYIAMPRPTPTIHIGSIEKYQRVRCESGLSGEELLAEQDVMELKLAKKAAAHGVKLMGAVKAARHRAIAATAAASLAAAVTAAVVPVLSRGRQLRARKLWPGDSDS